MFGAWGVGCLGLRDVQGFVCVCVCMCFFFFFFWGGVV